MEKILIATFDPTVFGSKTISEIDAFQTMKFRQACDLYAKLAEAHKLLKVPIHIVTAATLRNWRRKGTFPKKESIYYDPYTGVACTGDCSEVPRRFREILSVPTPDPSIARTFKRANNIAQKEFGLKQAEEMKEQQPLPTTSQSHDQVMTARGAIHEPDYNLPADIYNRQAIETAFKKIHLHFPVEDWPSENPPAPIGIRYTPSWPSWSPKLHKWLPEPTAEMNELYRAIALDRRANKLSQ